MNIKILTFGKCKNKNLDKVQQEYISKIGHYGKIEIIRLKGYKLGKNESSLIKRDKDSDTVISRIDTGGYNILLDERGENISSTGLSEIINRSAISGKKFTGFIIGDAFGLNVKKIKTDKIINLSPMTLQQNIAELVLLEQIYRAFTIIKGESYHK